jgi:hypothetical protein
MTDMWVCTTCKSLNRERDSRCYSCGSRKDEVAAPPAPEAPNLRLEAALVSRSVNAYHSSLPFAIVAGVLISIVALMGIYIVFEVMGTLDRQRDAFLAAVAINDTALVDQILAEVGRPSVVGVLHGPMIIVAVLAFGAWLSRVCLNIPVLGGGTPSWTPLKALVYPIIPILNVIKVPGMIQDALYRLDPKAGGFFLVLAAFLALVGSWLIGVLGEFVITANAVGAIVANPTREVFVATFGGVLDQSIVLAVVTELMTAIGAFLLVVIIARVESRAAARNREIEDVVFPATTVDASASAAPPVDAVEAPVAAHVEVQRGVPVYRPQEPMDPGLAAGAAPVPAAASDDSGPLLPPPPPA